MTDRNRALVGELLKAAPTPGQIICEGCDAVADSPPVGLPEGWDGAWRHASGWVFTCPGCLDRVETEFLAGGGYREARRRLGERS